MSDELVTLRLAHSPDSDDLVMWWPLTGMRGPDGAAVDGPLGRPVIETGRFRFETVARDVEELNKLVVGDTPGARPYDITAISCAAYPFIADRYAITRSGGSFGEGYGPKVVVREDAGVRTVEALRGKRVAVPGVRTSAFLTLTRMLGGFEHVEMLFSEIPGAVARGEVDAGLLIHEAQLTFAEQGLRAIADVGVWWEGETGMPLPLGLNVIRRDLDERFGAGTVREVAGMLTASIRHAVEHADDSHRFLVLNAGDRTEWNDRALVDQYLSMYVSGLTLDMGETGIAAIRELLSRGAGAGVVPACERVDPV
ncbi:MAG: menaquinone biosynthesis family protein [Phycisphaerales bacterium JB059]